MRQVNYPNISCGQHGIALGYLVCVHVIGGAIPKHHLPATCNELGELDCGCAENPNLSMDDLQLVCSRCAHRICRANEKRVLS